MRIDVAIVDAAAPRRRYAGRFGARARRAIGSLMKQRRRIAFQGEPGANSHIACDEAYPSYEPLPCRDLRGCLRRGAHRRGRARHDPDRQLGCRPCRRHPSPDAAIGTAHRGRMVFAGTASADGAQGRYAPRPSRRSRATSMRSASAATSSASSASRRWSPPIPPVPRAKWLEAGDISRAALATRLAAEDLRPANPRKKTSTTPSTTPRASSCSRASRNGRAASNRRVMTTFVFEVRNIPAALYKALGGFATNGVNMTKLESYMVGRQLCRDPVLRRCRRATPSDRGARTGARGAGVRLAAEVAEDSRRLPGARIPRDDKIEHNAARGTLAFEQVHAASEISKRVLGGARPM